MPVYKRDPNLSAEYYVSGNTVRRSARPYEAEPSTRRVSSREELLTRRSGSEATRRRNSRHAEPVQDTRSRQDRRRADPARAYYSAEPETQRLTRAQVNHRTVQQHAWQRAEAERRRREEEARQAAEEAAEQARRRQQRVHMLFAMLAIIAVVVVAGGIYSLLTRYIRIEQMTVQQRQLQAQIEDQQKRLEELQVEINRQGNISQVQDYARDSLNMDYAQKENTRVIALP